MRTFAGNVYPRKFSKLRKIGLIGSYFPIIVVKEKTAEIVESAETNGQSTNLKIKRTFSSLNENHLVSWLTFEFVGFIHILLTRKRGGGEKRKISITYHSRHSFTGLTLALILFIHHLRFDQYHNKKKKNTHKSRGSLDQGSQSPYLFYLQFELLEWLPKSIFAQRTFF